MSHAGFLFISTTGALLIKLLDIKLTFMFLLVGLLGFLSIFVILKIRDTEIKRRKIELKQKNNSEKENSNDPNKESVEVEINNNI
jgi:hypothetical protein